VDDFDIVLLPTYSCCSLFDEDDMLQMRNEVAQRLYRCRMERSDDVVDATLVDFRGADGNENASDFDRRDDDAMKRRDITTTNLFVWW